MLKSEYLAALATKYAAVDTPVQQVNAQNPGGIILFDGSRLYSVKVREEETNSAGETTAGYRNISFIVWQEGFPEERAMDYQVASDTEETIRRTAFFQWIRDTVSAAPDSFKGAMVHTWNEDTQECVFSMLVESEDPPTGVLVRKGYRVRRGFAAEEISGFNVADYRSDCRVWPKN